MKIEVPRDKLLSNYEVYQHLAKIQDKNAWFFTVPETRTKTGKKKKRRNIDSLIDLEIITKDLSRYLVQNNQSNDTPVQSVINLVLGLNMYKLEMIEKLQILNMLPRSMVLLYAIIEDCDQRFSEEECEDLLSLVNSSFPLHDNEKITDGDGADDKQDEEMEDAVGEESGNGGEEDEKAFEDLNGDLQHEVPGQKPAKKEEEEE